MTNRQNNKIPFASNEWAIQKIKRGIIRILAAFALLITVGLIASCSSIKEDKHINYIGNYFKVSTYTEKLEVVPSQITVGGTSKNIELNINLENTDIKEYNVSNNTVKIRYSNIDGVKVSELETQIIITSDINEINKIENTGELNEENHVIKYVTNSEFIIAVEQYRNKSFNTEELFAQQLLDSINECVLYSDISENCIYVEIDGLGVYRLDQLQNINYNKEDNKISIMLNDKILNISTRNNVEFLSGYEIENVATIYNIHTDNEYNEIGIDTGKGKYIIQVSNNISVDELKDILGV